MKKVSDLEGAELDYWVAKAHGWKSDPDFLDSALDQGYWTADGIFEPKHEWKPSIDWSQGGPIIEREKIQLEIIHGEWGALIDVDAWPKYGPTPLIAAMRAFVASKFGNEIEEIK